jgi:uncharacterized membrane protein
VIKLQKSIVIDAPVEKVFKFMDGPTILPEIMPSMVEVTNIRNNAKGWPIWEWVYKMGGLKFKGESDTIDRVVNKRITTVSTKGIQTRFDFTFEGKGGKTDLVMEIEYTVPIPCCKRLRSNSLPK